MAVTIIFAVVLLLMFAFFTWFGLIFVLLMGKFMYVPLLFAGAVLLYVWIVLMMFRFFKTKKRKQYFGFAAAAVLIGASVWPVYEEYKARIPTVDAEVDIYRYEPFSEQSELEALDEPASLQLAENLPRIDGATALYPLYAAFVQAVYPDKEYSPYDSEVMVNRTPEAYDNLFDGNVDLIFAAAPSEAQMKTAKQRGLELKLTPVGKEAFVFFVNKKNPVSSLTLDEIKGIYSGDITNWNEVGGKNDSIRAFQRPADSGSQSALERLMGEVPIMQAPEENVAEGMGGIIREVSKYRNYKNAIGYTFRYYSTEMVGDDEIKLLAINGVKPEKETIRSDEYPIANEWYAVTAGTENSNTEKFIEWILSPQGQQLVEQVGYVPVEQGSDTK